MQQQELSELLNKYHLRPDKRLGQHYLIDEAILEQIIDAADIRKDELVVEVGGGPGILTKALAEAGAEVLTIEYAREFCRLLGEEFHNWRNVHVLCDDALRVDFGNLRKVDRPSPQPSPSRGEGAMTDPRSGASTGMLDVSRLHGHLPTSLQPSVAVKDDEESELEGAIGIPSPLGGVGQGEEGVYRKMVANIPYQITNPLIRKILHPESTIEFAVLMIQKEVADRLVAPPGSADRGILTVYVEYYGSIEKIVDVPPEAFWPAPEVNSAVVRLKKQIDPEKRLLAPSQEKGFFWFVKQGFSGKRKKLPNSIAGGLQLSKNRALAIVEKAGISPDVRAEDLNLEQWVALFNEYSYVFLNKP